MYLSYPVFHYFGVATALERHGSGIERGKVSIATYGTHLFMQVQSGINLCKFNWELCKVKQKLIYARLTVFGAVEFKMHKFKGNAVFLLDEG